MLQRTQPKRFAHRTNAQESVRNTHAVKATRTLQASLICMATAAFVPIAESAVVIFPAKFIYGEWCGLSHPRNLNQGKPSIDEIDDACRLHDVAYGDGGLLGSSSADIKLVDRLIDIIGRGETWNRLPDGRKSPKTELSDKQFTVASAIASWFSGQKFIRLFVDIVNGDFTAVQKLGTSSLRTVAVPAAIRGKLITALSEEVGQTTKFPIDKVKLLEESTNLTVKIVVDVADAADWVIDEVSDRSETLVERVGIRKLPFPTPIGQLPKIMRDELKLSKKLRIKPVVVHIWDWMGGW